MLFAFEVNYSVGIPVRRRRALFARADGWLVSGRFAQGLYFVRLTRCRLLDELIRIEKARDRLRDASHLGAFLCEALHILRIVLKRIA